MSVFYTTKNFLLRQSLTSQALVNIKILRNPMHPLHAQIKAKFHDPTLKHKLVINFTASKSVSKKAVVRNYARRRTREAVYQALRERGYGKEGEPLAGGGREKGVTGSLTWFPTFESVNAASEELKAEVGAAVDRWLEFREKAKMQTRGGGGGKGGWEKKGGGGGGGKGKGKGKGKGRGEGGGGRGWEPQRRRENEGRPGLTRSVEATFGKEGPKAKKVSGEREEEEPIRRQTIFRRIGN